MSQIATRGASYRSVLFRRQLARCWAEGETDLGIIIDTVESAIAAPLFAQLTNRTTAVPALSTSRNRAVAQHALGAVGTVPGSLDSEQSLGGTTCRPPALSSLSSFRCAPKLFRREVGSVSCTFWDIRVSLDPPLDAARCKPEMMAIWTPTTSPAGSRALFENGGDCYCGVDLIPSAAA